MTTNSYFAVLWVLLSLTLPVTAEVPSAPVVLSPIEGFQREFEQYVADIVAQRTPGLAISVVINGKPILMRGYGVRKTGADEQVDTDTTFRIASVSKTFASAAVATLVQKGKLHWDDRLETHLANISFKNHQYAEQLTLRHLLSHTTGLMPHAYTNLIEHNVDYNKIIKKLDQVDFICAPGSCYGYQNVVYSLLGDVVETVSNDSFEFFVKNTLFEPLRMKNSSYGLDAFVGNENRATPHVWNKKTKHWTAVDVRHNYYRIAPAAGVNASISDMTQWLLAQLGQSQDVLSSEVLSNMHSKQIKTTRKQAHYRPKDWKGLDGVYYGLGWRVFDLDSQKNFVHHGGWVQGARAEMIFNTQLQMGMVVLVNSETKYASEIVPKFLQLYSKHMLL
jgi:beta-lactamase class C